MSINLCVEMNNLHEFFNNIPNGDGKYSLDMYLINARNFVSLHLQVVRS